MVESGGKERMEDMMEDLPRAEGRGSRGGGLWEGEGFGSRVRGRSGETARLDVLYRSDAAGAAAGPCTVRRRTTLLTALLHDFQCRRERAEGLRATGPAVSAVEERRAVR